MIGMAFEEGLELARREKKGTRRERKEFRKGSMYKSVCHPWENIHTGRAANK